jgi:hypothetical protein
VGPETGSRTLDKLDLLLFPIVLLLRVSPLVLALTRLFIKLVNKVYNYGFNLARPNGSYQEFLSTSIFGFYLALRMILFQLFWLHQALQILLSFPYHIWCGVCFWPRLYYHLYNPKAKGCSIWDIITKPKDKSSTYTELKIMPSQAFIRPLWLRFLVFSTYQIHGAYAHIHQKENVDVSEALAEAAGPALSKVWDPLCLAIPYQFLSAKLLEPPDRYMRQWMAIARIMGVYLIPLCQRAAFFTYLCLFSLPSLATSKQKRCRCCHGRIALSTRNHNLRGHTTVTFDTDGIPFIVNNSVTCIITNRGSLFFGNLTLAQVQVNAVDASARKHQYKGTICLELVNDENVSHTYHIPGGIYDPTSNFNLLRVPKLATFFNDKDFLPGNNVDSNGTTVKLSGCCSCLVWDHGKHTHHFKHGDSTLPEILLYPGHGYFSAFCLHLRRRYDNNIALAFSSSFSISPSHDETAALVSNNEDSDNKNFPDSLCGTQYNSQDDTQDSEGDYWYSPPPPLSTPPPSPPPPPPLNLPSFTAPSNLFELGMSLSFYDGQWFTRESCPMA